MNTECRISYAEMAEMTIPQLLNALHHGRPPKSPRRTFADAEEAASYLKSCREA